MKVGSLEKLVFNIFDMAFKFEKLRVWHVSMDFGERIFQISLTFPDHEKFNLTSQIRRASDSIALNIAEGSTGQSNAEFSKFLGNSIRSLAEVVTCLYKLKLRKYINEDDFEKLYDDAFQLMNQIVALRNSLK